MPKFGHKSSSTKYSFSNDPEPEISGPVEFQMQQWFTLKKWKNTKYNCTSTPSRIDIVYHAFFSLTDKLCVGISFTLIKEEKEMEYKIRNYHTFLKSDSFRSRNEVSMDRRALLQFADPSPFEYWLNWESGQVSKLQHAEERIAYRINKRA